MTRIFTASRYVAHNKAMADAADTSTTAHTQVTRSFAARLATIAAEIHSELVG
jgi:hypothetical protein